MEKADTPLYDHIELTPEETKAWTEWGLLKGRKKKAAYLAESEYRNKISSDVIYPMFSFDGLKEFVLKQFKDTNGFDFIIDESNEEIFEILCQYFSGDPSFEIEDERSFEKGIMLIGPIGCGKTALMKLFAINSFRPYAVLACRKIADAYAVDGTEALYSYSEMVPSYPQQYYGHNEIGRCFDDLGTEEDKKNFGNQVNVMQDIIYKIYDAQIYKNFHISTNISGQEIEEIYGARVRSRMRQMFNVFTFDKNSKDRRK